MNAPEEKKKRLLKTGFVVFISITAIFFWIYTTHKYVLKRNELCRSGILTSGIVYHIERTANNEGNISSWNVYYKFKAENSVYSGLINVRERESFAVRDSIAIVYSNHHPALHQPFENQVNNDCIGFTRALFKFDNGYIIILGLLAIYLISIKEYPE